jgi:CPA2 family monovalent cation:H+ antiporter-2
VPAAGLLLDSGYLLGLAALAGLLFRWLKFSSIPGFIVLGLALHPLVGESRVVEQAGTIGVVLLLFTVGLEFSFRALVRGRRLIVANGVRDLVLGLPVGWGAGLLLGWGGLGALFMAGAFYVSSSAIIAKSLIELKRTAFPETEVVLGVLVFEDLAVALLLALLSGAVLGGGEVLRGLVGVGIALAFFAVVAVVGLVGRGVLDWLLEIKDEDLFLLAVISLLLMLSGAAVVVGLSEAIGAFLAGALLAETRHRERIETLITPLQGIFAALFFLSFGLAIDVRTFGAVWLDALWIAGLAIVVKVVAGWWIGRRSELSRRASLAAGFAMIPRGEFSIVLAGIAAAAGYPGARPLIGLLVLILAILGTALIRYSPELAGWRSGQARPPGGMVP